MAVYFNCDGKRWQVPSVAPGYLATITPERFAGLFFALPVNNKRLGIHEIKMLLTQCFISMVDNRYGNGIQSVNISRGRVIQQWKDDKFWRSKAIADHATIPSTPNGASLVLRGAPERSFRGLFAPDVASDQRKDFGQAQSRRRRGPDRGIDHGRPVSTDPRLENRRAASPNANELRDRLHRRLEDRVEDPWRRIPPTAEKTAGTGDPESTNSLFKRVKVEHQKSPRPEPLALNGLPPGHQLSSAQNAETENRSVTNGQPYSPTTPHLNVSWPMHESSVAMDDSVGREPGLSGSPALRRSGLDAQISEHARRGSLKRAREHSVDAHAADGTIQPAPRAAEKPTEHDSMAAAREPGKISDSAGAAEAAWMRPMRKPESVKPIQAILTTAGISSLPSPSDTPKTTSSPPFAGFFKPDDTRAAPEAPLSQTEKTPGKLPISNSPKQRQTQPRSATANTHMILLETLLRGAVRELADTEEPASAHHIRVVTLLNGAVAELGNLKNFMEGV